MKTFNSEQLRLYIEKYIQRKLVGKIIEIYHSKTFDVHSLYPREFFRDTVPAKIKNVELCLFHGTQYEPDEYILYFYFDGIDGHLTDTLTDFEIKILEG
jgi:hypothetical protein